MVIYRGCPGPRSTESRLQPAQRPPPSTRPVVSNASTPSTPRRLKVELHTTGSRLRGDGDLPRLTRAPKYGVPASAGPASASLNSPGSFKRSHPVHAAPPKGGTPCRFLLNAGNPADSSSSNAPRSATPPDRLFASGSTARAL